VSINATRGRRTTAGGVENSNSSKKVHRCIRLPQLHATLDSRGRNGDSAPPREGSSRTFFRRHLRKGLTRKSDSLIKLPSQSGSHFDWFFCPEESDSRRRPPYPRRATVKGPKDVGQTSWGTGCPCDTRPRYRFARFTPRAAGKSGLIRSLGSPTFLRAFFTGPYCLYQFFVVPGDGT